MAKQLHNFDIDSITEEEIQECMAWNNFSNRMDAINLLIEIKDEEFAPMAE